MKKVVTLSKRLDTAEMNLKLGCKGGSMLKVGWS